MKKTKKSGFTLIELLVVISIIGLLSTIVAGSLSQARTKAYVSKDFQEMKALVNANELYKSKTGKYIAEEEWESYYGGDPNYTTGLWGYYNYYGSTGIKDALQPLVTENLIRSVPGFYKWPNNTDQYYVYYVVKPTDYYSDGAGYWYRYDYFCGSQKVENFMFYIYSNSGEALKLPTYNSVYTDSYGNEYAESNGFYSYCVGR